MTQSKTPAAPEPASKPEPAPAPGTKPKAPPLPKEVDGPKGPEPTRYGDWERKGRVSDF
ncbi:succinate dehydrogenase assembly factor 4 [Plastoroseomonas hellenica]|uniref:succinate dehydrogenase assembly factor 4 n=1 Tax=Plastoroseomonas hellenica TaxID=2687306 RepID=UPI001BA5C539|nr:succinate dehydrogenase assembly factor 4 [Plastoroseomonas hellenica]MBR0643244.1 DUF1674 domain-containing protein [Plastoroseomonas hellenica]